jgi:hypothetical protein
MWKKEIKMQKKRRKTVINWRREVTRTQKGRMLLYSEI